MDSFVLIIIYFLVYGWTCISLNLSSFARTNLKAISTEVHEQTN